MKRSILKVLKRPRIKIVIVGLGVIAFILSLSIISRTKEKNMVRIYKGKLHVAETKVGLANALLDTSDKIAKLSGTSNSLKSDFTKLVTNLDSDVKELEEDLKNFEWKQSCDFNLQEFENRNQAHVALAKLNMQNIYGIVVAVDSKDQHDAFVKHKLMIPPETKDDAIEALKTGTSLIEIPSNNFLDVMQAGAYAKSRGLKCGVAQENESQKSFKFNLVVLKGFEDVAAKLLAEYFK